MHIFKHGKQALAFAISIVLGMAPAIGAFVHPGIPLTKEDLATLKGNIATDPWKAAYEALAADGRSSLNYKMQGPFEIVSRTPNINLGQYRNDMQAVYNLSLMWYLTGNQNYAKKAHDIILAWAQTHKTFGGAESYLTEGDFIDRCIGGTDILRGTWPGWTGDDTATCKKYFSDVYWQPGLVSVPGPLRSANQGIDQFVSAIAVAVFCDDDVKFKQCIDTYRGDACGGLLNSLSNGQIGDTGRDQGHSYGELLHLAWSAEVAWKQGVDLYSESENRLLAAGEYFARYNHSVNTPFLKAGTVYGLYETIGGAPESSPKQPDMLNILYGAYVVRKGMNAPYLTLYRATRPETQGSFMYRKTTDHSTAKPLAALVFPQTQSVTKLQGVNIGGATPGGSAAYARRAWTVTGGAGDIAGNSDRCYFAYLRMSGDGAVMAQVVSLNGTDPKAKAGVMIRKSLESNSPMIAVYTNPVNGSEAFMRGQTASSHHKSIQRHPLAIAPYWLKAERIGSRITVYDSPDGANWTSVEAGDFDPDPHSFAGLCVTAHMTGETNTAIFNNVRITGADGREIAQIPPAPFAIYASPGNGVVPLRWLESFCATGYKIKRSIIKGGPYETIAILPHVTSYIDMRVTRGTTYYYAVSAFNVLGESPNSPEDPVAPIVDPNATSENK